MRREPNSNEVAYATESAPQCTVEFGRWNTSAPREARLPSGWVDRSGRWCGSATSCEMSPTVRSAALAEGSRALRERPRGQFLSAGGLLKSERQASISRLGVQPNQYGEVGDSQPPAWSPYGASLSAQNSAFTVRSLLFHSDYRCDASKTNPHQKKNQTNN